MSLTQTQEPPRQRKEPYQVGVRGIHERFERIGTDDLSSQETQAILADLHELLTPHHLVPLDIGDLYPVAKRVAKSAIPTKDRDAYFNALRDTAAYKGHYRLLQEINTLSGQDHMTVAHALEGLFQAWGTYGTLSSDNNASRFWTALYGPVPTAEHFDQYLLLKIRPDAPPIPIPLNGLEALVQHGYLDTALLQRVHELRSAHPEATKSGQPPHL